MTYNYISYNSPIKEYSPMIFKVFTELCNHHYNQFLTLYPFNITPNASHFPSSKQPKIFFLSLQYCLFWAFYKWNHLLHDLFWLFSLGIIFLGSSRFNYSMYQYCIPFYNWIIFCYMDIPYFVNSNHFLFIQEMLFWPCNYYK